ncbi:MAG: IclR family transcriptional regulator [Streptosporangiales bacterium]
MAMNTSMGSNVRSVLTALRILEEVSTRQPVGVSELARGLQLPKTSVHRILGTLREAGWVRPSGTDSKLWSLTHKALTVGLAGSIEPSLREVASAEMRKIRDATGETVHLGVAEDDQLVIIGRLDGTRSLRTFLPLGTEAPLHATASGRALLSAMPDEDVERILDLGLRRYTGNTILDRAKVWKEIRRARQRGYGRNAAEWREGIAAVAAAIRTPTARPVAAITISMPLGRYRAIDKQEMADLVIGGAERAGAALHADSYGDPG